MGEHCESNFKDSDEIATSPNIGPDSIMIEIWFFVKKLRISDTVIVIFPLTVYS